MIVREKKKEYDSDGEEHYVIYLWEGDICLGRELKKEELKKIIREEKKQDKIYNREKITCHLCHSVVRRYNLTRHQNSEKCRKSIGKDFKFDFSSLQDE